jgi:large subunit ribosomal protein L29
MKAKEVREMTVEELNKKLEDLKVELFNLRFQHAVNQLENTARIGEVKKDIARVKTVLATK